MATVNSAALLEEQRRSVTWETTTGNGSESFEVNVIFTEQQATAAALRTAELLARGLGAYISLRAAIVVPMRLPLDQSPVSVPFMEQLLSELAGQPDGNGREVSVSLYVCRDSHRTFLQELKPHSLVVIGGRKHWWPTRTSRLARALRTSGHQVAFVDAANYNHRPGSHQ